MAPLSYRESGFDDRAFLAGLHDALDDYGREHQLDVEVRAERTVGRAQQLAPRGPTGELIGEIHFTSSAGYVDVIAGAGYSAYHEYGTSIMRAHPFMRPALAEEMES